MANVSVIVNSVYGNVYSLCPSCVNDEHGGFVSVKSIRQDISDRDGISCDDFYLLCNGRPLYDYEQISLDIISTLPPIHVKLRLLGGKGGFGSLLRGGSTRVGQKKNF